MYFTEDHLKLFIAWARWRTLRSLGVITDDDPYPPADPETLIALSDAHARTLRAFIDAYSDWFAFHLELFKAGRQGRLTAAEQARLADLIKARESAMDALLTLTRD